MSLIQKAHIYKKQFQIDDEITIYGDHADQAMHGKITKIYGNYTHYDVHLIQTDETKYKVAADKIVMTIYEQYAAYISKNCQPPLRPGSLIAFAEKNDVNVKYAEAKTIINIKPDTTCIYKREEPQSQKIMKLINDVVSANKFKYPLLSRTKFKELQNTDDCESKECQDQQEFEFRSNVDFDQWMQSKDKYDWQFRNEIAGALKIKPGTISMRDYRRGSVIGTVCIGIALSLGVGLGVKACQNSKQARLAKEVYCNYRREMVVQDQIEVKYKNEWYQATISNIDENGSSKTFTVRYNPKDDSNGWDPFVWNTESFEWKDHNLLQDERLRYPGKVIKQKMNKVN